MRAQRDQGSIVALLNRAKTSNDPADWSVLSDLLAQTSNKSTKIARLAADALSRDRGSYSRTRLASLVKKHLETHLAEAVNEAWFESLLRYHGRFLCDRFEGGEIRDLLLDLRGGPPYERFMWLRPDGRDVLVTNLEAVAWELREGTDLEEFFAEATPENLARYAYDILVERLLTKTGRPSSTLQRRSPDKRWPKRRS